MMVPRFKATGPVLVVATLLCGTALAAEVRRVLQESAEIKSTLAKIKEPTLKQDPGLADCAPKRHQTLDAVDWRCKVGALRAAAAAETVDADLPVAKNKGLLKRARLVSLALDAADALGFYKPAGEPPKDLSQWQVESQWEACRASQELYGVLLDIPEEKPAGAVVASGFDAKDAPRLGRPLKETTCDCFERTMAIGRAGFLSERDPTLARAQKQVYSMGCNLKTTGREVSRSGVKKERSDVDFSTVGGAQKGTDLDKVEAEGVAERRKKELTLCIDDKARGAVAAEKMAHCACPLIQRWHFPKRELDKPMTLTVVVADKLAPVAITITPKGIVEKCEVAVK